MGSSFGEPLWGAALPSFPEQLSGTIASKSSSFGSNRRGQLYNFREQLSVATFGSSLREPLCRIALGSSFGAIALDSSFGKRLLVATLWRSFRDTLCRMALGSRLGEQVCIITALGQQLWRTALGRKFGGQRWGTALGSSFGDQLWTAFLTSIEAASGSSFGVLGGFFGTRLSVATLKSSFGEQLWGATVGSNFAALQQH